MVRIGTRCRILWEPGLVLRSDLMPKNISINFAKKEIWETWRCLTPYFLGKRSLNSMRTISSRTTQWAKLNKSLKIITLESFLKDKKQGKMNEISLLSKGKHQMWIYLLKALRVRKQKIHIKMYSLWQNKRKLTFKIDSCLRTNLF